MEEQVIITKKLCDLLRESDYKLWYSSCSGSTGDEEKWKFQTYFGWDYKPDGSKSAFDEYVKQIKSRDELNAAKIKKQVMTELKLLEPSKYKDEDTQSIYTRCLELDEKQVKKLIFVTKTAIKGWIVIQYASDKEAGLTNESIDNLVTNMTKKL